MKRSFPVNINGHIFNIDEDAYTMLKTYLEQLRLTFSSPDEREIVDDIEGRIEEHFSSRTAGNSIITITDVTSVIEIMGSPDQLSNDTTDDEKQTSDQGDEKQQGAVPPPYNPPYPPTYPKHKLYRNIQDKVFGGVLSGIATYLNWNTTILRLIVVIATITLEVWPMVLAYIISWMVIPPANTPRQQMELEGKPVTPDAIGKSVTENPAFNPMLDTVNVRDDSVSNVFSQITNIIGKAFMAIVGFVSGSVGVACAIAGVVTLFFTLFGIFATPEWVTAHGMNIFDGSLYTIGGPAGFAWVMGAATFVLFAIAIPALLLLWGACCVIFKSSGPSKSVIITSVIIEILLIGGVVLCSFIGDTYMNVACATLCPLPVLCS